MHHTAMKFELIFHINSLSQEDLRLICNNCMIYNQPDTVYYKAAKKLLHAGEKILSPERILPLKKEMQNLLLLTKEQVKKIELIRIR